MKRLFAQVGHYRTLYASTKGAPFRERLSIVRKRLRAAVQRRLKKVSRRSPTGHVTLVFRNISPERAIQFFWTSATVSRSWHDVEARMRWVHDRQPDHLADFVKTGLRETRDPMILVNLAHHPLSADLVGAHLLAEVPLQAEEIAMRFQRSESYSAAYVGVLMLRVGEDEAARADAILRDQHPLPRRNYTQFLDSISTRIREHGVRKSFTSGFLTPKRHRLIIVESAKAFASYSPLMYGADHVTLFDMSDIYGKTNLSYFDDKDVPPVTLEHIRTRITRFSRSYHQAHEDSKNAAISLTEAVFRQLPADHVLRLSGLRRHMELDVADQVFFELLKARVLRKLLEDDGFDHIVVALNAGKPESDHYRTLSCVDGLADDPRVEFTSVASTFAQRLTTQRCVMMCKPEARRLNFPDPLPPITDVLNDLAQKCASRMRKTVGQGHLTPDSVVFLTNSNPAYNPSTIAYVETLKDSFHTQTLFVGSSLNQILKEDPTRSAVLKDTRPLTLSWALLGDLSDLSRWSLYALSEAIDGLDDPELAHLCRCFVSQISRNAVHPGIALFMLTHAWCERQAKLEQLPAAALLTPVRSAKLGMMAEAMRLFDIPSIALEPHGLNGNYCRYSKVTMDFYAVISNYFANTAENDFGIAADRCHVVGTPRIVAPEDYDPAAAHGQARADLAEEQDIRFGSRPIGAFFCQPSEWAHVEAVWGNILDACKRADTDLLLKPHPEEAPIRVARYFTVAERFGMADRIQLVDGKPDRVIEACDFVLTGYSAAALDAAVLEKPVFCVTADGKPYPVDQHSIANAPLCGSADELYAAIADLIANPEAATARSAQFLTTERQFVEGPDARLTALVRSVVAMNKEAALRPHYQTPQSLFLDGPFQEFSV